MPRPFLDYRKLTEAEREIASHLDDKLGSMDRHITCFEHAVLLFESSLAGADEKVKAARDIPVFPLNFETIDKKNTLYDRSSVLMGWAFIAARDAAITTYHFRATLHSVIYHANKLPNLEIDGAILEAAKLSLEAEFPDVSGLRHAISHDADNSFTMEKRNKHAFEREDGLLLIMSGNLVGNIFQYTNRGEVVSLTIASSTLSTMRAIQEQLYSAFPSPQPRFGPRE